MMGKEWHPFLTILELIRALPKYVDSVKEREANGTLYCN